MKGFLGTGATFSADLNLLAQFSMGAALLLGMFLAKRKKFRAHAICQTSVLLLNLVFILRIMIPSFHGITPQLPAGLRDPYYAIATLHAALGSGTELMGFYILLVAGTKLIPEPLRFRNWKAWMRAELVLWWLVIVIGVGTYGVWYMAPGAKAAARAAPSAATPVVVHIANFSFAPKEIQVKAGGVVEWVDDIGRHSVIADDGSFDSGTLLAGAHFDRIFAKPGAVPYHCGFHGAAGGKDMAGTVIVLP